MNTGLLQELNSGSRWNRWEPHIHAPGTVFNDQFGGVDAWDRYLKVLEEATPVIRALGITDYYSTKSYERLCHEKSNGRLPGCSLIFPNIEMRLGVGTVRGSWVNIHLLVSPEDISHLAELERFLARLTFKAFNDSFCCRPDELIKLGDRADPKIQSKAAALEHGSKQFKVSFEQLKEEYFANGWAQANILIAVAANTSDGTSGLRDPADATLRQEIEKFADTIFASSPSQREFWLGQKALTPNQIRLPYGGLKPCLHGSDAHNHDSAGVPKQDRYSWIKGALEFDALRQACIEPDGRAYVGDVPAKIFVRMSLHLLSLDPASAPQDATGSLLDKGLITENWCNTEYAALAVAWYPSLTPENQAEILRIVDAVPDEYLDWWKARFEEQQKVAPTPEDVQRFRIGCVTELLWTGRA